MIHQAPCLAIDLPPKVWRPKQQSRYVPPVIEDDIDDSAFDFKQYGRCVARPNPKPPSTSWTEHYDQPRDDIIIFDSALHDEELTKDIRIGNTVPDSIRNQLKNLVIDYWDCFCKEGARRTIIGYEFAIDTGDSKPVCCKKPYYGPYESEIILEQIKALLANGWIEDCEGPWGSMIVLAPKPHQEACTDINKLIWRMCVSYRKLNSVTKPFEFPIPRCDAAISSIGAGECTIHKISLDARQGYHQVKVKPADKEKLAFFSPDNTKKTFNVMPFGPTNAPGFYSAMMLNFKREWTALFFETLRAKDTLDGMVVVVDELDRVYLDGKKVNSGSKTIIDDILVWSGILPLAILLCECVMKVFQKYRVSFRLDKCDFLKDRVEYVGHDICSTGNAPAQSKFDMINDWTLPTNGQSLISFVGLVNFYHRYAPYMEIRLKPLRRLVKKYYRKEIPQMAWTADLIALFNELKKIITSSPVLARFDSSKPTFLKTDWSGEGMGWILMQPADDEESHRATAHLLETGECVFDLSKNGTRLRPVAFGSRACSDMERLYHSFVGEVACGRWAISQNCQYLWGNKFYWLCDCSAVREILEYDGTIPMICRWAQELLGYDFDVIHRNNRMMVDVDALTRRFGPLIAKHMVIAAYLRDKDKTSRPKAYENMDLDNTKNGKLSDYISQTPIERLITHRELQEFTSHQTTVSDNGESVSIHLMTAGKISIRQPTISTWPISYSSPKPTNDDNTISDAPLEHVSKALHVAKISHISCLVLDDPLRTMKTIMESKLTQNVNWQITEMYTNPRTSAFVKQSNTSDHIMPVNTIAEIERRFCCSSVNFLVAVDTTSSASEFADWTHHMISLLAQVVQKNDCFHQGLLLSRRDLQLQDLWTKLYSQSEWSFYTRKLNPCDYGDCISTELSVVVFKSNTTPLHVIQNQQAPEDCSIAMRLNKFILAESLESIDDGIFIDKSKFDINQAATNSTLTADSNKPLKLGFLRNTAHNTSAIVGATADTILDSAFPGLEPSSLAFENNILGRRFGIITGETEQNFHIQAPSDLEMLLLYSCSLEIAERLAHAHNNHQQPGQLDDALRTCIPFGIGTAIFESVIETETLDRILYNESAHVDIATCYQIHSKPREILAWEQAYFEDTELNAIFSYLRHDHSSTATTTKPKITDLPIAPIYKNALKRNQIYIDHNKLILEKDIMGASKTIRLVIVPKALRRQIFSHFHAGPTGGHMGEYKTLYRMRVRIFWPKMREDIKEWVRGCKDCVSYNIWRNRKQELHFSWPVTLPFYIVHVDLWSPGDSMKKFKTKEHTLLNTMCDLTQFVVSIKTAHTSAEPLATLFMEHVTLTFGMTAVVVVDADSRFKGAFQKMCDVLKIQLWPLSRGNHKALSIERYHRFLNKTHTIASQERNTHEVFLQNYKLSQYAWNGAPIDGTDVVRSVAAIGRPFQFPIDTDLTAAPNLNNENHTQLFQYLRAVSDNSSFATAVLQILIEDRRETHRDRWNRDREGIQFKVGDIVKAHVQVQSNATDNSVGKLSFRARGPFKITEDLGNGSYLVTNHGDEETGTTRKYKSTELYMLPPVLYAHDPIDTIDQRFLNYSHSPALSPMHRNKLQNSVDIHLQASNTPHINLKTKTTTSTAESSPFVPSFSTIEDDTNNSATSVSIEIRDPSSTTPTITHNEITQSKDKIIAIAYTPANTIQTKWYLVQIDLDSTARINPDYLTNGKYYCTFLCKHPDDQDRSDEFSRWWPEWHEYRRDSATDNIIYGNQILLRPNANPDPSKYIQYADTLPITTPTKSAILLRPFNFEPITTTNRTRQKIPYKIWKELYQVCLDKNIFPPTLGALNSYRLKRPHSKTTNRKKKKPRN